MNLDLLREAGVDVEDGLRRFMNNEAMFEKYLKKFLDNDLYEPLVEEMSKEPLQTREAFERAHALKGVCANLSMSSVMEVLHPMVEKLRVGETEGVIEALPQLQQRYDRVMEAIKKM